MIRYKPVFIPHRTRGGNTFNPTPSRPYAPERADGEIEWVFFQTEGGNTPSPSQPRSRLVVCLEGGNPQERSRT